MKKFFLAVFLMLDLAVMAVAGLFLYARLTHRPLPIALPGIPPSTESVSPGVAPLVSAPPSASAGGTPSVASTGGNSLLTPHTASSATPGVRHIGFTYRNAKAKKVDIKADFTQWKSEPMIGKEGVWTYTAALPPGEYQYCFIVDDSKGIRDPTNKRTKQIGTTYVSAINVEPLAAKPK